MSLLQRKSNTNTNNVLPEKTNGKNLAGRKKGVGNKLYVKSRNHIAKKSDSIRSLIAVSKGEPRKTSLLDKKTGEVIDVVMRPSIEMQVKAMGILINKIVPDVKSVDITTSSDESASFPTREKLLDMFRELAVDTDYSVESIDKETPDNPIEQAGSTPGSTESTGIDDK